MDLINLNIKYLRKKENMSQEAFADLMKVNRGNIASYEGGSVPNPTFILNLCKYYNIDFETLLTKDISKLDNIDNIITNSKHIDNSDLLEKSNKMENGHDNKNDNKHDNKAYILEENQGLDRVEEEEQSSHKTIKQSNNTAIQQGLSPPEADILKKEILYLKEILKSKEEVLKAKDKHIELLEEKIKHLEYQLNNLQNNSNEKQLVA